MGQMNDTRKIYLDYIRFITVLLVLIYHVFYMFNGVGILGGIQGARNIPAFDTMACIIYPWFMALLFVIAGISARYSLQKRTGKQFLKERAAKLLVPSTLGLFLLHWITGYLNIKMGGGLAYIPKALIYPISAVSGTGPLWFIQMLFLFSCLLVLLRKIDKADKLWTQCGKINLPGILLLFLPVFASAQVGNMPVLTMYRFGIYFISFLIGYYIFSHEKTQENIEKIHVPMLCLSIVFATVYAFYYGGSDYTAPSCLQSILTNLYLWAMILAIIGCGRKYCQKETAFTRYMAQSSFGIYIVHYPVLTVTCYILHQYFSFPAIANYAIALIVEIILTFAVYEIIKRIPLIRFLVLGIKKKPAVALAHAKQE